MYIRTIIIVMVFTPPLSAGVKTGQLLGMGNSDIAEGLYEINIDTAEPTLLLPFDFNPSEGGLAVAPDGTLYAAFSGDFDQLVILDLESGALTFVGEFGFADVSGLDFAPDGKLYGLDDGDHVLIDINLEMGQGTLIGDLELYSGGGLSFSLDGDLHGAARKIGQSVEALWKINTQDASTLFVGHFIEEGAEQGNIESVNAISFIGSTLYMSATWQFREIGQTSLYAVDPDTAIATRIGPFTKNQEGDMAGMAFLPGTGDVDRDGDVDEDDFAIFEECFTGPIDDPEGEPLSPGCIFLDTDDDNDIDCDDFEDFVEAWTEETDPPVFLECRCDGDANLDGVVDPLDSGYVLARLSCSVGTGDEECDAADVNADGVVDPLDSGYVLARFGTCE